MARLCHDAGGRKRLIINGARGKSHTVRLGVMSTATAEKIRGHVTTLENCKKHGAAHAVGEDVIGWASKLPDEAYGKYANAGLLPPRHRAAAKIVTLGQLVDEVKAEMGGKKQFTQANYQYAYAPLLEYFAAIKPVASITPRDADAFLVWQREKMNIGPATLARRIKAYRLLFNRGIRWKYCAENPFTGIKAGASINHARKVFVPAATVEEILAATADLEFRAIIALCRYGAVRCPSEVLALRWVDVRHDLGQVIITSSKTEGHTGGESRVIPLFPELDRHLTAWQAEAPEGEVYVISRTRDPGVNFRKKLETLITKAGVVKWPKLFHNLRASRESELCKLYPLATVCKWLGHRPEVAAAHYLTDPEADENFQKAAGGAARQTARRMGKFGEVSGSDKNKNPQKPEENRDLVGNGVGDDCACKESNLEPSDS